MSSNVNYEHANKSTFTSSLITNHLVNDVQGIICTQKMLTASNKSLKIVEKLLINFTFYQEDLIV